MVNVYLRMSVDKKLTGDFIKASGAIAINHSISLVQQQLFNVLLSHAFYDLAKVERYEIELKELLSLMPNLTNHVDWLKENLTTLRRTDVTYNLFGKGGEEWGVFGFIESPKIVDGKLYYSFPIGLKELLDRPKVFAKLNLIIQQSFRSKFSLFIYELSVDYKGVKQTPLMKLADFRSYVGCEDGEYQKFSEFNRWVIKVAVKEINSKSDLLIEPFFKRTGRKVSHIKFYINPNPNPNKTTFIQLNLPLEDRIHEDENTNNKEPSSTPFFQDIQHDSDKLALIKKLLAIKVQKKTADGFVDKYATDKILKSIEVFQKDSKPKKNPTGYIKRALENDWEVNEKLDPLADSRNLAEVEHKQKQTVQRKEEDEKRQKLLDEYAAGDTESKCNFIESNYLSKNKCFSALTDESRTTLHELIISEVIETGIDFDDMKDVSLNVCRDVYREQEVQRKQKEREEVAVQEAEEKTERQLLMEEKVRIIKEKIRA